MSDERITRCGKEILLDGRHLADAVDDGAAEVITLALTYYGAPRHNVPHRAERLIEEFFS
jgi:hypothetical protein